MIEDKKSDTAALFINDNNESLEIYEKLLKDENSKKIINNINEGFVKHGNEMGGFSGYPPILVNAKGDSLYQSYSTLLGLYSYLYVDNSVNNSSTAAISRLHNSCIHQREQTKFAERKNNLLNDSKWKEVNQNNRQEAILANCKESNKNGYPKTLDMNIELCVLREGGINFDSLANIEAKGQVEKYDIEAIKKTCDNEKENLNNSLKKEIAALLKIAKPIKLNIIDEEINRLKSQNKEGADRIANLKSEKNLDDSKNYAEKYANNAVYQYSLTHIMQGIEIMVWEYNDVSKDFFIKSQFTRQIEYGDRYMDANLNMEKIIFSATRNINDVDQYMNIRRQDAMNELNKLIYNR
ncbi:hypothetical protein YERSI8AC_170039 [Enterobacterales bacterium 8AC]|nr:hypothetical protein YERSI8AC_170039 [Enterobacterales bacterium 8AC]